MIIEMKKNFGTSWSKLSTFETCPWKFWLLYGSKHTEGQAIIPFQTSKALEEGNIKHELLETAIHNVRRGRAADADVKNSIYWEKWWGDFVEALVRKFKHSWVEQRIAVDTRLEKCTINKYYQPNNPRQDVFMNGKLDAVFFDDRPFSADKYPGAEYARIIDWKSGKVRAGGDSGQLASQAWMLFKALPSLKKVDTYYVFIDYKKVEGHSFIRKEFAPVQKDFVTRILKLRHAIETRDYPCTPDNCHWCPATKEHCAHSKK